MRTRTYLSVLACVAASLAGGRIILAQQADTKPLFMTMRLPISGVQGRIDRMAVVPAGVMDAKPHLLVAATSAGSVEGISLDIGMARLRQEGLVEPQGVMWLADVRRLAVACGDGTVRLYECAGEGAAGGDDQPGQKSALQQVASVRFAGEAEDLAYDASSRKLYVAHGRGVSQLDAASGETGETSAKLDGHAEDLVLGRLKGGAVRLFASVARPRGEGEDGEPATPHIAVIDPASMEVVAKWPMGEVDGEAVKENHAMAFDAEHGRLLVACRRPAVLLVFDAGSGGRVASMPCAPGADGVAYDARTGLVFVTGGEQGGKISVFAHKSADEYEHINTIDTLAGASTCVLDEERRLLLVVAPGLGQGTEQAQATLLHYEIR